MRRKQTEMKMRALEECHRQEQELIEEQSAMTETPYDPRTKGLDLRKYRVANLPQNSHLVLPKATKPGGRDPDEEREI